MSEVNFLEKYYWELVGTAFVFVAIILLRIIAKSLVTRLRKNSRLTRPQKRMVLKYIDFFNFILLVILLITVWGVESRQAFLFISSIFTVIGVAMFAQWSILSNVTAGIIIFFNFPFKIGDKIKVIDKDNPIEAEIIDIKSFYTLLKTGEGERISLPNNLLLQKAVLIMKQ